jgi:hypothetical protein
VNISERSRIYLERIRFLQEKKVGPFGLLVELKPILLPPGKLFSGRNYLDIFLTDAQRRVSRKPVIRGAHYSVGGKGVQCCEGKARELRHVILERIPHDPHP